MIDYFKKNVFDVKSDQMDADAIHASMIGNVRLKGAPLIILFCAIVVASVGLNINSTAVIIGAMLISPLMNPIIAMGYSIATYDGILLRNASINFATQILIALVGASFYFFISPIHEPTSELLSRIEPSFFDMMIAFFGGIAGVIAITRIEKSNVIPGVAIATALMPPLCTVGYGIANGDLKFVLGAGYLFAINAFFIVIATFIMCKVFQLKQATVVKERYNKLIKRGIIIGGIIIIVPVLVSSLYVGFVSYERNQIYSQIESFVNEEVNSATTTTMRATVFAATNELRLDLVGEVYPPAEVAIIKKRMVDYGLEDYQLTIVQDLETTLFNYFEKANSSGLLASEIMIR